MKKFLIYLLALSLIICSLAVYTSCDKKSTQTTPSYPITNTPTATMPTSTTPTKQPTEFGQEVYNNLLIAAELCDTYKYAVYNAWYFSIYEFDDYTASQKLAAVENSTIVSDFAVKVKIPKKDLQPLIESFPDELGVFALSDFNSSVGFVLTAFENNGTQEKLDSALSSAKATLKELTEKHPGYSECENLKKFYTEVNAYAEYIKSPTGSFETMKTTTQTHQNNVRTAKSALDFAFGS